MPRFVRSRPRTTAPRRVAGFVIALAVTPHLTVSAHAQSPAAAQTPPVAQAPAAVQAPASPLFEQEEVLHLTLTTDLTAFTRDRDSTSQAFHPATLTLTDSGAGSGGKPTVLDVQLRTRGHWRRQAANCTMPPVLLVFSGSRRKHTPFAHQKALKLVVHCRDTDQYEQYILAEFQLYRVLNRLTPISFRVRLARVTYVDGAARRAPVTRYGFLVEDQHDMARRNGGTILKALGATYENLEPEQSTLVSAFEYMIGNTDWSMYGLHNIRLVSMPQSFPVPVPYDFDFSGAVDTRYAAVDPRLRLASVRHRLYRGICRTPAEWAPTIARFNAARGAIYALYDSLPALRRDYVKDVRSYFDEFYRTINDPHELKENMIEPCRVGA